MMTMRDARSGNQYFCEGNKKASIIMTSCILNELPFVNTCSAESIEQNWNTTQPNARPEKKFTGQFKICLLQYKRNGFINMA